MNCPFMYCDEPPNEKGWRRHCCPRCGIRTGHSPYPPEKHRCNCRIPGWGDWLAYLLLIGPGIDKERTTSFLRWLYRQPTIKCACDKRQEQLNRFGWKMALAGRWLIGQAKSFFRKRAPRSER